jgi:uncharacterized protein YukE
VISDRAIAMCVIHASPTVGRTESEITMTMFGANPEQLAALGRNLQRQEDSINSVLTTVSSTLAGTSWTGPARDQFESDWNTTFRTALTRLNEAFEAAGKDCINRSDDLQRVMGAR